MVFVFRVNLLGWFTYHQAPAIGLLLLGICFWRAAPGIAVGPDRPACRSLGEDRRAGKRGVVASLEVALEEFRGVEDTLSSEE